jgi:hypothetical protein
MAIGRLKIGKLNVMFVFRHRWERKDDPYKDFQTISMFREWELGFWFKPSKMIGVKGFTNPKHHLVNMYMLGINLLVCKAWVEWDINGLHIKESK